MHTHTEYLFLITMHMYVTSVYAYECHKEKLAKKVSLGLPGSVTSGWR